MAVSSIFRDDFTAGSFGDPVAGRVVSGTTWAADTVSGLSTGTLILNGAGQATCTFGGASHYNGSDVPIPLIANADRVEVEFLAQYGSNFVPELYLFVYNAAGNYFRLRALATGSNLMSLSLTEPFSGGSTSVGSVPALPSTNYVYRVVFDKPSLTVSVYIDGVLKLTMPTALVFTAGGRIALISKYTNGDPDIKARFDYVEVFSEAPAVVSEFWSDFVGTYEVV